MPDHIFINIVVFFILARESVSKDIYVCPDSVVLLFDYLS